MRKIFYTLGAAAVAATPLIAVVSCGSKKETNSTKTTEQTKPTAQEATKQVADLPKPSVGWSTLTPAKPVEKITVDYTVWSERSFNHFGNAEKQIAENQKDLDFWKTHQINGEDITNLPETVSTDTWKHFMVDLGDWRHTRCATLETATKIYYFSPTNYKLAFNPLDSAHGAWVLDKATNVKTYYSSEADMAAKVVVTAKAGVQIQTKLPFRSFDATSVAEADKLGNFKLNGHAEDYTVAKEGLYVVKHDYDGTLWQGDNKTGHALTDEIAELPQFTGLQTVLEMGKGDSIYFLFNDNDNDELSPNNFLTELAFVDTSAKSGEAEVQFNGNAMSGVLDKWEGSQTNHASGSFDEAMMKLMHSETPADFAALAAYYGVKTQPENGHFVDDPAHANHASRAFFPMGSVPNYFGYQRVAKNAFKITFNNPLDINMSMGLFRIYNQKTQAVSTRGSLSLGTSGEWSSYEHSQTMTYNYVGRKDEFLTK